MVGGGKSSADCKWVHRLHKLQHAQEHLGKISRATAELQAAHGVDARNAAQLRQEASSLPQGWSASEIEDLFQIQAEHPARQFANKKARWLQISTALALPGKTYKLCQKAFKKVHRARRASAAALKRLNQGRIKLRGMRATEAAAKSRVQHCQEKLDVATHAVTFQRHLNYELRTCASITEGEHDTTGRFKAVEQLLKRGADPNASDTAGYTALMEAGSSNAVRVAEALLDAGADVHLVDDDGRNALRHALESGSAQAAQLLLQRGAKLTENADKLEPIGEVTSMWQSQIKAEIVRFVASESESALRARADADASSWFRAFQARHHALDEDRRRHAEQLRAAGALLQPPSALEALKLGLEGSSQRKKRLQRESRERRRHRPAARMSTPDRNLASAQGRAQRVVQDAKVNANDTQTRIERGIHATLHRASTRG